MTEGRYPGVRIHPSALIEDDVALGGGTAVWDNVHVRHGAQIGSSCILGEKTYVAYDVQIGDRCKLNACVYVCAGVTIGDDCMISAHVVFTNDLYPRAFEVHAGNFATSEPTDETLSTKVDHGVTIGANATIGPGLSLGEFSMVGMGSVVTADVPAYALVLGNPARIGAWVCACGPRIATAQAWEQAAIGTAFECRRCGRAYERQDGECLEVRPPKKGPGRDDVS